MKLRLPLPLALVSLLFALPAAAQTSLPTRSRPIPDQIVNRGAVQIDLTTHFGVPGVVGQVVRAYLYSAILALMQARRLCAQRETETERE
jgi:hypothetical protein